MSQHGRQDHAVTAAETITAIRRAADGIDVQLRGHADRHDTAGAQAIIRRARASLGALYASLGDLSNYLADGR